MSKLFGGGGGDGGAAARAEERLKKQEADLAKKESMLSEKTQASMLARRGASRRSLLSAERPDELGVTPTKLGGGSGMA